MMRYSQVETSGLAVQINKPQSLKDLNQLIVSEGYAGTMPVFTNSEIIIDMDYVEEVVANEEGRNRNKSMDSSAIITNDSGTVKEILLVEFRFNYLNMRNLDKRALFDKVTGSINALNNPTNIHNKYIYIFNSNLKQQAIRRFRNMVPSMPTNYIAADINDLKTLYF